MGKTYVSNQPVYIPKVCDNQEADFIERPVTADLKNYFPYLDISSAQFGANRDWLFARINIYDAIALTGAGDVYYFFKLDLNFDGRDSNVIVFSVRNLPLEALTWTVGGVQAWKDVDGTISPVFDEGVGADPDLVWARRSPNAIEFAFKPAILDGPSRFAWWGWSYQGTLNPTDIALAPISPDLYQIDNTCARGFNGSSSSLVNSCLK